MSKIVGAALVAAGLALGIGTAHYVSASHQPRGASQGVTAVVPAQTDQLAPFTATGLPAGPVMGVPSHLSLPPGFSVKHIHGGPTYVYVISGSVDLTDSDGTRASYGAGSFFWEAAGHVHTASTSGGVEIFELQFLPPGAESLVPVQ